MLSVAYIDQKGQADEGGFIRRTSCSTGSKPPRPWLLSGSGRLRGAQYGVGEDSGVRTFPPRTTSAYVEHVVVDGSQPPSVLTRALGGLCVRTKAQCFILGWLLCGNNARRISYLLLLQLKREKLRSFLRATFVWGRREAFPLRSRAQLSSLARLRSRNHAIDLPRPCDPCLSLVRKGGKNGSPIPPDPPASARSSPPIPDDDAFAQQKSPTAGGAVLTA